MTLRRRKPHASVPLPTTAGVMSAGREGTIWARLVQPERGDLTPDAANSVLGFGFDGAASMFPTGGGEGQPDYPINSIQIITRLQRSSTGNVQRGGRTTGTQLVLRAQR